MDAEYLKGWKDGWAEGFKAGRADVRGEKTEPEEPKKHSARVTTSRPTLDPGIYISRTPFDLTKELAFQYLKDVSPRVVGPTEIIKNVWAQKGMKLSYTTVRRALEELVRQHLVEAVGSKRWRASSSPTFLTAARR